jgi:ribosomal protein S18 acetylase RimI-like enzyme
MPSQIAVLKSVNSHVATIANVEIRLAIPSDAPAIALAHRDSIRSLGCGFYPGPVLDDWAHGLGANVYIRAMEQGEVFFVATGTIDGSESVLGFASDYCREGSTHGTSVYVRGAAARRGIGSALFRRAEAHAVASGAASLEIEASLAGVDFYAAHNFVEIGRGETRLKSGRPIACVFMRKTLPRRTDPG